jgi:membrane protein DedA with SNARE-associated domain
MPWPKFLFWNALGVIAWATAIGLLAYFGGKALADAVSRYGLYAGAAAVAAAVLILAGQRLIRRLART